MKKLMTLLLALTMAFALVACGGTPAPAEEDKPAEGDAASTPAEGEAAETPKDGEKEVLRVAMECAYAPYNWAQPTDANGAVPIADSKEFANGYDVMMAKIVAEKLGYELEIVQLGWDGIIPAIQSGTVDIGICGQSVTSKRMQQVDFTDPYYFASIVSVVPQDGKFAEATKVADLDGATVTSQLNTIWDDVCVPQIPNVNAITGQKDAPAMIAALVSGRVDAIITDQPTGLAAVTANPDKLKMLEFTGEGAFEVSEEDINIGISVKKDRAELVNAINGVLADYDEDTYKTMMNDAIKIQPLQ